jgi:hypothetical protein
MFDQLKVKLKHNGLMSLTWFDVAHVLQWLRKLQC